MSDMRFKIGDKVKRTNTGNTCWMDDEEDFDHFIITAVGSITYAYEGILKNGTKRGNCGCYKDKDLEYYSNGEPAVPKRTFKLLKDSPSMLKGALLQEYGDSTSPYIMLNQATHALDPNYTISFAKRELVEDQPKWFVEVFQVEPQFMTREELEQFDAFKKSKTTTKKKVTKK